MSRPPIVLIAVLSLVTFAAAAAPQTLLTLNSRPGDWVGQGVLQTFTPSDGLFTVQPIFNGGVEIFFHTADYSHVWDLRFGPPGGHKLQKSEYEAAENLSISSTLKPGMEVSGEGRGCNIYAGRFLVSDISFALDGSISRLAIDFEQHCDNLTPALYGTVRYQSVVTTASRLGIADTDALKGNTGNSNASVLVSLAIPSQSPVTAHYTTVDGTAVAGTDYIGTSGVVQFPAGKTLQVITIPIVGDRLARGNKIFKVTLDTPVGALIGDGTAQVKIFDPNVAMTALVMSGDPGEFVGQGQSRVVTVGDGVFTKSRNADNGVSAYVDGGIQNFWSLDFAGPANTTLLKGNYSNAQRYPFQPPATPGLAVSGDFRGCNILTGNFVVNRALYRLDGSPSTFSVDFEQHCEGGPAALFGSLRIGAPLTQISITNAVISDSNAVFTVTLNPASTQMSSVTFATQDKTALGGLDYEPTNQSVIFLPGEVEHQVSVPLLTTPTGQKSFYGNLWAPRGAPAWISQGTATF